MSFCPASRAWEALAETALTNEDKASGDAVPAWQLFALAGLLGATFVVFLSRGQSPAAILLLSVTVFAAAAIGVAALRALTPLAGGDLDAVRPFGRVVIGGRTRAALEREKALTLRSIKELEFDRAMGKVSDADFLEMSGRLRTRAASLIQRLDDGRSYRQQIDQEIARRLGPEPARGNAPIADEAPRVSVSVACAGCGTANDPDARFCKQCGAGLTPPPSVTT